MLRSRERLTSQNLSPDPSNAMDTTGSKTPFLPAPLQDQPRKDYILKINFYRLQGDNGENTKH